MCNRIYGQICKTTLISFACFIFFILKQSVLDRGGNKAPAEDNIQPTSCNDA